MRLHEPLLLPFAARAAGLATARYQQFPERDLTLAAAAIAAAAALAWLAHSKRLAFAATLIALVFGGATPTLTDGAVAAGRALLGDPGRTGRHREMLGTAKLLRDEHVHPVELREAVTSPGGTTIRAIRELEQAGVRAAFLNAINAAMERSKELARGES